MSIILRAALGGGLGPARLLGVRLVNASLHALPGGVDNTDDGLVDRREQEKQRPADQEQGRAAMLNR
jgi:hypothetical protein